MFLNILKLASGVATGEFVSEVSEECILLIYSSYTSISHLLFAICFWLFLILLLDKLHVLIKNSLLRKLALKYHPDKNPGNPEAESKVKKNIIS